MAPRLRLPSHMSGTPEMLQSSSSGREASAFVRDWAREIRRGRGPDAV